MTNIPIMPLGRALLDDMSDTYMIDAQLEHNDTPACFSAMLLYYIEELDENGNVKGTWKTIVIVGAPSWSVIRSHIAAIIDYTRFQVCVTLVGAEVEAWVDYTDPPGPLQGG